MTDEQERAGQVEEFCRRLRHQLSMRQAHIVGGCERLACPTERLIDRAIGDSWTTLTSLGYAREANDIMHEEDDEDIRREA